MEFLNPQTARKEDLQPGTKLCRKTEDRVYIASIGYADDWAVYEGSLDEPAEETACHGNKISEARARELFLVCADLFCRD